MKTILCYGDSNTWGCNPENGNRFDFKTRWTMVLKNLLNKNASNDDPEWWVVEEGQGGRTSCREDEVEGDKNGLRQLIPILESHKPIDIVAVMLGTNDLKLRFNPTAFDIARGVQEVAKTIKKTDTGPNYAAPKVLVICPPATRKSNVPVLENMFGDTVELSKKLPPLYRALAIECGAAFLDAGQYIESSAVDGIHLDAENHRKLAEAVAQAVREMCS